MEFTYQEKIAVMRILLDIIHADGIIDERETFLFNKLKDNFNLADEDHEVVREKNSLIALTQIKQMSKEKKVEFARLMGQMIIVDEDINVNEVAIYNVVAEFCDINTSFDESVEKQEIDSCSKS